MPLSCSSSCDGRRADRRDHSSDDERGPRASTTRSAGSAVDAGHTRDRARLGVEAVRGDTVPQLDARFGEHEPAQHPLERGAPARDRDQLVVARPRSPIGQRLRQVLGERDLGRARVEQRVEHVGRPLAEEVAQTGEECVRVPHLRRARALPRRTRHRRRSASACRRARGPSPRDRRAAHASAVPSPAIPPPSARPHDGIEGGYRPRPR